MKLISFAVVSLLAITVSAQPPLSTSADKDVIKQKLKDLWAVYPAQNELVLKLREPSEVEQKEQAIRLAMKEIEGQLERKDLPESERPGLEKCYAGSVNDLEKAESALVAKQQQLEEAREQRYDTVIKINILSENLKREAEPDVKDKSKMDASSSLSPHRDILQEQINEVFQDADDLYTSDQGVKEGVDKLDEVIKRTKNPKISKLYETWDKFTATRVKYIKQVGLAIHQRSRTKELQAEFGWTSQNSRVWDLYQSFLLMI